MSFKLTSKNTKKNCFVKKIAFFVLSIILRLLKFVNVEM